MASTQVKAFKVGAVQRGIVLQLLFCHSLIVAVTVISGGRMPFVLCACLLSFLLMLNIPCYPSRWASSQPRYLPCVQPLLPEHAPRWKFNEVRGDEQQTLQAS